MSFARDGGSGGGRGNGGGGSGGGRALAPTGIAAAVVVLASGEKESEVGVGPGSSRDVAAFGELGGQAHNDVMRYVDGITPNPRVFPLVRARRMVTAQLLPRPLSALHGPTSQL